MTGTSSGYPVNVERPSLLAFDVNETLLSLAPIKAAMDDLLGAGAPVGEWFARMLHGSLVANETETYRPFGEIGVEALLTVAAKRGRPIKGEAAVEVVSLMESLPPHPEVYNALERLFDAGYPMVALTNSSTSAANAQIENAGLHPFLRRVVSVEEIGRFKPDRRPYQHAAEAMGVEPGEMMLIAAHDWDCLGALHAGARSAFVKRQGVAWSLPTVPPEVVVSDIAELAEVLTN